MQMNASSAALLLRKEHDHSMLSFPQDDIMLASINDDDANPEETVENLKSGVHLRTFVSRTSSVCGVE